MLEDPASREFFLGFSPGGILNVFSCLLPYLFRTVLNKLEAKVCSVAMDIAGRLTRGGKTPDFWAHPCK